MNDSVKIEPMKTILVSTKEHCLSIVKRKGTCSGHCNVCPVNPSNYKWDCYKKNAYKYAVDWLIEHGFEDALLEVLI